MPKRFTVPLLSLLLAAATANAEVLLYGTRPMGMGETGHSLGTEGSTALYYNPASITRFTRFTVGGNWRKDDYNARRTRGQAYDAAVIDSLTGNGIYGGGVGWLHHEWSVPGPDFRMDVLSIGMSYSLGSWMDFGMTNRYLRVKDGAVDRRQWAGDFGLMSGTDDGFISLGMVWRNVYANKDDAEEGAYGDLPQSLAWGASTVLGDMLTLAYDGQWDMDNVWSGRFNHHAGVEVLIAKVGLAGRYGYIWDRWNEQSFFTWGVALVAPKLSLGFAWKEDPGRDDRAMMFELTMVFPASGP